jgi:hypothetical protein
MAWPIVNISKWEDFENWLRKLLICAPAVDISFLYRGQSDSSWHLQSTIMRNFKPSISTKDALTLEDEFLQLFRSQAHVHLRPDFLPITTNPSDWWQIMQHYSAPTRLIDWTESPYVAAYFAVVQNWDKDGLILTIPPFYLNGEAKKILGGSKFEDVLHLDNAPDVTMAIQMVKHSNRTMAQQGHFTVSANILGNQESFIDSACSSNALAKDGFCKLIIPKKLKPEFLYRLKKMNVTAASLFPGEDGLGKSIYELSLLSSVY